MAIFSFTRKTFIDLHDAPARHLRLMGLLDEIEILEPEEFKEYVKKKVAAAI